MRDFRWPSPENFNFGLDWFDLIALEHPDRSALAIVEENGDIRILDLRGALDPLRPGRGLVARSLGVSRGDRVILMLGNQVELWEVILAVIKLGAVLIPASTLLSTADLRDRLDRGRARFVIARDSRHPEIRWGHWRFCSDRSRRPGHRLDLLCR